ncbi:MAG: AMP-binding protein [Betaproteobacteria bacterium]|nr:AMP-binding protein [Betaproteobacteria bacterium]
MERIWLKSYPEGIPTEIDPKAFVSIKDMLAKSCERFAPRPAFTCMDKSLTFAEVNRMSRQFAAYLQSLGLKQGDRVAVMMPNILQYPVAVFGILRAGMIVVNTNPLYTARELEHQLHDSGAKAVVILENFAATLEQVLPKTEVKHVITTQLGDFLGFPKSFLVNWVIKHKRKMVPAWNIPHAVPLKKALSIGSGASYTAPTVVLEDLAFLQYTGGTTGVPKGAMLTHGNIVANLLQVGSWTRGELKEGQEVVIQPLPLYHIFALTSSLVFMKLGAESVLIPNPRDMDAFIGELKKRRWSVLNGVNTLFNGLLNHPEFKTCDFSGLKLTLGGGMAVQRAVAEQWKQVTGHALIEAYGLTETSPGAVVNPITLKDFNGCIGLPLPSTVITIRDDDEKILAVGETGEICITGPQVMKGYWQRPDETAKVMTKDGAFKSGDIGFMNADGYVKIVDRKKDMILVSGFNVYPNEIEDVVAACPGVLEVCAVAANDEKSGEVVRAVIVKKDPELTKEKVLEHCKAHLTGYKVPKIVEFWDSLPKTNVGKVLRREVKNAKRPS